MLEEIVVKGEVNELSHRAAMGLPERYVAPECESMTSDFKLFSNYGNDKLLEIMTSHEKPLSQRFCAGVVLSGKSDPRISPFDPRMVDIPECKAPIGLNKVRIDEIYQRYKRFGVQRIWIEKECPRFEADIAAFKIAKYPVTNFEFLTFLKDTNYGAIPSSWANGRMAPLSENSPVYTILPEDADAYVGWLARKTGRKFRLPDEFEWECAASGPQGTDFPWGMEFVNDVANTLECNLLAASPVGIFPKGQSVFGVDDMAGNVEEYVSSVYFPYEGGEIVHDDLYKLLGNYRIARGGAFNRFGDLARCQRRHGPYPNSLYAIGFRVAEDH